MLEYCLQTSPVEPRQRRNLGSRIDVDAVGEPRGVWFIMVACDREDRACLRRAWRLLSLGGVARVSQAAAPAAPAAYAWDDKFLTAPPKELLAAAKSATDPTSSYVVLFDERVDTIAPDGRVRFRERLAASPRSIAADHNQVGVVATLPRRRRRVDVGRLPDVASKCRTDVSPSSCTRWPPCSPSATSPNRRARCSSKRWTSGAPAATTTKSAR